MIEITWASFNEDRAAAEEIEAATQTPEAVARAMEERRNALAFRLWDADGDGRVSRKPLADALSW